MTQPSTAVDGAGTSASDDDDARTRLNVTTLLVVQQGREAWLDQTLTALVGQHRRPDRLVVIDATPAREMADRIGRDQQVHDAFPDVSVVAVPADTPFAAVIDTAVDALPAPGDDVVVARRPRKRARAHKIRPRDRHEWLWLLHEDSAPDAGALDALVHEVALSDRLGVAGCKVTRLDDHERLVNVGMELTRAGRHIGTAIEGQLDQGQHDDRRDVLAVSSAGMLVRRDVYTRLGGFDPAFDGDGDGLDLCWRAHLSSHQVVVVPTAQVHQDLATAYDARDRPAARSARTVRRHRQVALARASLLGMPLMAVWTALSCLVLAVMFLLLKRPRRAGVELAQASAPLGLVRIIGARARFFRRGSTRRRNLRSLFVPFSRAYRAAVEGLHDAVALEDSSTHDDATGIPAENDVPAPARSSVSRRLLHSPGTWVVLLLAIASAVMWRDLLGTSAFGGDGHGLAGGVLRPFSTDASGIWHLWRDAWQGPGLGHAAVAVPYLPVLAGLTWLVQWVPGVADATAGATTLTYLLVACMPLSGWSAYRAARVATRTRWPRAAAALAWGSLATLTTAVSTGRLGPAVAHVLLPLAVAGVFQIARRRSSTPATFGTTLALAGLGAFAPPLLVLTSVMGLVAVVIGRGWGRLRGLIVAVVPWLLLAPWTLSLVQDDWRRLLAGPGGLTSAAAPDPWHLALLHPGGPGSYAVLASVPVLIFGVVGLLRSGFALARVCLIVLGLLGLAGGLAATHLMLLRTPGGQVLSPWAGTSLDVLGLALIALALLAVRSAPIPRPDPAARPDAVGEADSGPADPAPRRIASRVRPAAVALAVACGLGMTGFAVWTAPVDHLQPAHASMAGIVDDPVHGTRAVRVLSLTVAADGGISYTLKGQETGLPVDGPVAGSTGESERVAEAVGGLIGPGPGSGGVDLAQRLHRLGVHAVVVHGNTSGTTLTQSLEATGILTPLRGSTETTVWRVAPMQVHDEGRSVDASRVTLFAGGHPVREVTSSASHAGSRTTVPDGPKDRLVVLSEGAGWADHGSVTLDGHALQATTVDGWPAYRLGSDGGDLQIDPGMAFPELRWAQLGLLVVVLFLAIPFGNKRSRGTV